MGSEEITREVRCGGNEDLKWMSGVSKPIDSKSLFHLKLSAAPHTDDDPYMSPILEFDLFCCASELGPPRI